MNFFFLFVVNSYYLIAAHSRLFAVFAVVSKHKCRVAYLQFAKVKLRFSSV